MLPTTCRAGPSSSPQPVAPSAGPGVHPPPLDADVAPGRPAVERGRGSAHDEACDASDTSSGTEFSDPAQGFASGDATAASTPTQRASSTPWGDVLADAMRRLLCPPATLQGHGTAGAHEEPLRDLLTALHRSVGGPQWHRAYDQLLLALVQRGEAMPGAPAVAAFLRAEAGRRVLDLHAATQAGTPFNSAVVPYLRRFKLNHGNKWRLAEVRGSLGEAAQPEPDQLQSPGPARALGSSPPAAAGPLAPPLPAVRPGQSPAALPAGPEGPAGRPLAVRKMPWRPAAEVLGLEQAAPVSALCPSGPRAPQLGAALVLVGRSFARGSYAKVKPALVLPAAGGYTGTLLGDYVARTLGGHVRLDPVKALLRGPYFDPLRKNDAVALRAEAEALEAAGSGMRPVLTLTDEKDNVYQLVPRFDFDVRRAVQGNERLRQSAAFVRAVLEGVLPRLVALHAADIVHHDIKPENLLVDAAAGRVELADYGLARRRTPAELVWRGTHLYRPPEMAVLTGAPDRYVYGPPELTCALDLYALAATVAQLVAPRAFTDTPLAYFRLHEVQRRKPDLVVEAQRQLQGELGHAASYGVHRRAYGLYVAHIGRMYGDWYEDNADALLHARRAADLDLGHCRFGRLIAAVAEVDLEVARLVARGLHPDPRRRGSATTWMQALRQPGAAPSPQQGANLHGQLLAAVRADPHCGRVEQAFAQLRAAAAAAEAEVEDGAEGVPQDPA